MNSAKQKTILLVEDDALLALNDSQGLTEYGYNVIHALTGEKAIEVVNNNQLHIDLILMDINLGKGMDGTEAAKIILKDHNIPILFHSSHTERDIVEMTENISSYGYVVKNGMTVLDASIKMAFKLHDAYLDINSRKERLETKENDLAIFEKRYHRLFESAKDGILILNADSGKIVDVNPYLINLLGYTKEQFLEKSIWDISTQKSIEYSKQLFKELQEKQYVRYENLPLETFDGSEIQAEFVSNVYLVDNEKVIQCNIRDIGDRKKKEDLLQHDLNNKEEMLKELKHRTKNSFAMITSLIRLSSDVTNSEETQEALLELTSRVKSISDLYLLLHKTDAFYEVDLKTYCHKVIDSMGSLSMNIRINRQIEEITVATNNAATIGMILVELLSNSIKYAFPNKQEGVINIEVKIEDSQLVIIVEDNGIGLPKGFDAAEAQSLGLHLVNLMVSQLEGNIKFHTENGTKVRIETPYEKVTEGEQ